MASHVNITSLLAHCVLFWDCFSVRMADQGSPESRRVGTKALQDGSGQGCGLRRAPMQMHRRGSWRPRRSSAPAETAIVWGLNTPDYTTLGSTLDDIGKMGMYTSKQTKGIEVGQGGIMVLYLVIWVP